MGPKIKRIHSQDAGLKVSPKNSGETSLNLSTEILEFITDSMPEKGQTSSITLLLYKEDFLKGLAYIISNLPLYKSSSTSSTRIDFSESYFNELYSSVQEFFGDHSEQKYEVNIYRRSDSRIYLNNLRKGLFSIRDFLIEELSVLKFYKIGGRNIVRLDIINNLNDVEEKLIVDADQSSIQKIFYGSPGTGKSYKVEHDELDGVNEDFIFRTTFHPDSDYASFVGAYKPLKKDDSITYDFEPQAFTKAYVKAWQNPAEQVYLVIEEINRGNCAQIFGDLFQLLDRKNGVSEYPVNADAALAKYLKETLMDDAAEGIANEKLKIPENLNIIATMNTSDQSLFPMDSAFKRRWDWVYIPTTPPVDKEKSMILHIRDTNADHNDQAIDVGDYEYKWTEFLKAINKRISAVTHSDDKQLGFWFVKTPEGHDEISVSTFVSKVVFYLWNDVFKDMGPKSDNPFTVSVNGKNEIMTFNSFFEVNSKGEIVENLGVVHTFMCNLGLDPKLNKEIETAQQETELRDETVQQ